jgi:hypothetical protein
VGNSFVQWANLYGQEQASAWVFDKQLFGVVGRRNDQMGTKYGVKLVKPRKAYNTRAVAKAVDLSRVVCRVAKERQ